VGKRVIFDLGFAFWDGGSHAVAVNTREIFKNKLEEEPYCPFTRWQYFVMQDGLIATYPTMLDGGGMVVILVAMDCRFSQGFHALKGVKPFPLSLNDPSCEKVCFAASNGIDDGVSELSWDQRKDLIEDVWCLSLTGDMVGWSLLKLKSRVAIGLDFLDGDPLNRGLGEGKVNFIYADRRYRPKLYPPPVVS
jgi:hypothetical protein